MAIRFVDKPDDRPRKPAKSANETIAGDGEDRNLAPASPVPEKAPPASTPDARAGGEARFATPIEAVAPVNPDASGELPFTDLPRAEKAARRKRTPKSVKTKDADPT